MDSNRLEADPGPAVRGMPVDMPPPPHVRREVRGTVLRPEDCDGIGLGHQGRYRGGDGRHRWRPLSGYQVADLTSEDAPVTLQQPGDLFQPFFRRREPETFDLRQTVQREEGEGNGEAQVGVVMPFGRAW